MKAYFLSYLIEASVCQTAFYLFYRLFLRNETSFAFNRMYLLLAILLSVAIPFIEIPVGESAVYMQYQSAIPDISPFSGETRTFAFVKEATETSSQGRYQDILFNLYITICCLLLIRLLYQLSGLLYFYAKTTADKQPGYSLIHTNGKLPTFSFFRLLFWDNSRQLSTENTDFILKHELTHIRQWHSLDIVLLELLKIIFWFNPAIYLLKKSLQEVHEYLADATVITHQNAAAYVELMVNQLFTKLNLSFTSSFNHSQLKTRITMIHKTKTTRPAFWKAALSLPIVALLTFIYSCRTDDVASSNLVSGAPAQYQLGEIVVVGYSTKENSEKILQQRETASGKENKDKIAPATKDVTSLPEENQPAPAEGYASFYKHIQKYIKYPAPARDQLSEGKVWLQFTVKADGTLTNLEIYDGVQQDIDQEVIRVVQATNMRWKPAMENGKPVDIKLLFPVTFKLGV